MSIYVSIFGLFWVNKYLLLWFVYMYIVIVNGLFKLRNLIFNEKMLLWVNKIIKENFMIRDKCWNDLFVN